MKRSNFYPNGEFIPYQMPQDFRPSQGRGSCGNCGMFSERRMFCGVFRTQVSQRYLCLQQMATKTF